MKIDIVNKNVSWKSSENLVQIFQITLKSDTKTKETFMNRPFFFQNQHQSLDTISQSIKKLTGTQIERQEALYSLSLQREAIPDLAILLWESPGTIASLLSEIISICPQITSVAHGQSMNTPIHTKLVRRVCYTLTLFQTIAGNKETQLSFIHANIPMYLFPFLHTTNSSRECECFKLTSLGIIGNLVKTENAEIIDYLNQNGFVPLCLRILKFGQEISKLVSAFIIQKILSNSNGRAFISQQNERIETLLKVLNIIIFNLASNFNPPLALNIVLAYRYILKIPKIEQIFQKVTDIEKLKEIKLSEHCDHSSVSLFNTLLELSHQ